MKKPDGVPNSLVFNNGVKYEAFFVRSCFGRR